MIDYHTDYHYKPVWDGTEKNLNQIEVFEKDLLGDLTNLGEFDFIYCQEVLHHTSNPKMAFLNLCDRLSSEGEIAIYVYKLKAPIREFADDYIREKISGLSYEKASELMEEITKLGEVLSDLKTIVSIPKVELLGIEAGEYDLQRFLYHFFLKCFWNPELDWGENVAINYDWYHPQLCSRHTPDEILGWFSDAQLEVQNICVDHYGITVRGKRKS
jgi:SAM-dependent methyltransferase